MTALLVWITSLGTGLLAGLTWAALGYLKSINKENANKINTLETFDVKKFFLTLGVGAFIGLGSVVLKMPLETANAYLVAGGFVALIESVLKAIWRRYLKGFFEKIGF